MSVLIDDVIEHVKSNANLYRDVLKIEYEIRTDLINTEPVIFHEVIDEQFIIIVREKIADDIVRSLGCDMDTVTIALESINLMELFK
ncbi:hypothetical protein EBZ38_13270 [bacterium]|nr:hypothetical protein [bacterium]